MRLKGRPGALLTVAATGATVLGLSLAPAGATVAQAGTAHACTAAQLSLSVPTGIKNDPTAGMDRLAWNILLSNSGAACTLDGWPALTVHGANARPWNIKTSDVQFSNLNTVPEQTTTLARGGQAVVTVDTTDETTGCAAGWTLGLKLPTGGTVTSTQPRQSFGPCGSGATLDLSPFYSRATLNREIKALGTSAVTSANVIAGGANQPAACTARLLHVSAAAVPSGAGTAVQELRLTSRTSASCYLPGQWPTVLLHESTGGHQIAKSMVTKLPNGATASDVTKYGKDYDVTVSPAHPVTVALLAKTTGQGCHQATSASVYPNISDSGSSTPVAFAAPVTFCGEPQELQFLSGSPAASALRTAAAQITKPASVSPDGDSPVGYYYGSDSNVPTATSSSGGVYTMPDSPTGGDYGIYVGEIGDYAKWQGCTDEGLNWNNTNYTAAQANASKKDGVGAAVYWMAAGPGREPSYSSTNTTEAYNWGQSQAERVKSDFQQSIAFPWVFMDIEDAAGHGWNGAWDGPCGGTETATSVPSGLDRSTYNGFWDYIKNDTSYHPSQYIAGGSAGDTWSNIFGSGQTLTNTGEWTYTLETTSVSTFPTGWGISGTSTVPQWYASAPAKCDLLWQWSGGNGQINKYGGDFDQLDSNNTSCD